MADPKLHDETANYVRNALAHCASIMLRSGTSTYVDTPGRRYWTHEKDRTWDQQANRDLGFFTAFLDHLGEEVMRRGLAGWPPYPRDRQSPAHWDLYWLATLHDELHRLTDEERPMADLDAEMEIGIVEHWRAAGARTVLIVGNGVSYEPRALATAGFDVTAVDLSAIASAVSFRCPERPSALRRYARATLEGAEVPDVDARLAREGGRCRYLVESIADPNVAPGPYDVVIARRTVQCGYPKHLELLDVVLQRVRPGGFMFLHEHNMRREADAYREHLRGRGRVLDDSRRGETPRGDTILWITSG